MSQVLPSPRLCGCTDAEMKFQEDKPACVEGKWTVRGGNTKYVPQHRMAHPSRKGALHVVPTTWSVGKVSQHRKSCAEPGRLRLGQQGQVTRYQVYVHFWVAKGPPAAVTRDHTTSNFTHGLLSYQINGKVFIHLEQDEMKRKTHVAKYISWKISRNLSLCRQCPPHSQVLPAQAHSVRSRRFSSIIAAHLQITHIIHAYSCMCNFPFGYNFKLTEMAQEPDCKHSSLVCA